MLLTPASLLGILERIRILFKTQKGSLELTIISFRGILIKRQIPKANLLGNVVDVNLPIIDSWQVHIS